MKHEPRKTLSSKLMVFVPYELSFIPNAFVLQKDQLKYQSPHVNI